ncbi:hypothetical protein [Vibrio splendidus]
MEIGIYDSTLLEQSEYIIDAYYYMQMGKYIVANGLEIGDIFLMSPNLSTIGVVSFSSAFYWVFGNFYVYNVVIFFVYLFFLNRISNQVKEINVSYISLVFLPLLPYLFIISKEAVMLLSIMCLFLSSISEKTLGKIIYLLSFIVFVLLSRPEFLMIALLSFVTYKLFLEKGRYLLLVLVIFGVYISPVYDFVVATSISFQNSALTLTEAKCNYSIFDVCIRNTSFDLVTYIVRIALFLMIPLKWVIDLLSYLINEEIYDYYALIIKGCYFIGGITFPFILYRVLNKYKYYSSESKILIFLSVIYIVIYSALLFFQGSRQFAVFLMMLCLIMAFPIKIHKVGNDK